MRVIVLLLLLLLWVTNFAGQPQYSFTVLDKEHGLADNNVEVIFKDTDGVMWFGTRNGLCKFNGYDFTTFKKSAHPKYSIASNRILDIAEDMNGNIWVGTYKNGLSRINKITGEVKNYNQQSHAIGDRVNRIKCFSDGSLWICSSNGLAQYMAITDSFKIYLPGKPKSLKAWLVHDILETTDGEIYVAPEFAGLQIFNPATQLFDDILYQRDPKLNANYRKRLLQDNNGIIWITAQDHGLCCYNPKTGKSQIYTNDNSGLLTNVLMGSMALDNQNNLWLCTEEQGINLFNTQTKQFTYLRHKAGVNKTLNSDHLYSVYIDNNQVVWLGTFDKGINVYNPHANKFSKSLFQSSDLDTLQGKSVLDIFEDSKLRIWAGTDGNGLYLFEKGKKTKHFTTGNCNFLSSNVITSLGQDHLGNILIGTYTGGLISYNHDTGKSTVFLPSQKNTGSISSANVWEIFCDNKNTIWIGLLGTGVDEYQATTKTFTNRGPYAQSALKIDFHNIMVVNQDAEGDIWFGTEGKGVYIYNSITNKVFQIPNDTIYRLATEGIIKAIIQDRWGYMWIGTEDNGLFRFDKKNNTFKKIVLNDNNPYDPVLSLVEDRDGNIWAGTTHGLFRIGAQNQTINVFFSDDGLSSNDFNADAMTILRDGRIIAGTKYGADIIEPNLIELNKTVPEIVFTKLLVLNHEILPNTQLNGKTIITKNIQYTNNLELDWRNKSFTLHFAAVNYTLPQKCKYKYMLRGFDKNWIDTDANKRFASYSNLDPGEYQFMVKASNNDGIWGDNQICMNIKIVPPFHKTLVFKILIALTFILLSYAIYRWRINIHKSAFAIREQEHKRKIVELENEKLETELKKMAFNILDKNKLLLEQKTKIQNLSLIARENVKQGLQKVINNIDAELSEEKDWEQIEPQINKAYNQFILKLKEKHPGLTTTELRISAYIRMNLPTKEISELMNKTPRAVESDRYRLRKKIGLDSNDSLQQYFLSL